MLVQRVLLLIQELQKSGKLIPCDASILQSLKKRFSSKNPSLLITADDIQFILNCYKKRWQSEIDDDNDYMLNPQGVNAIWIKFAQELEICTSKTYYQILIPTVTNTRDFNNLSQLSETTRLENFYLGEDKKTLYRKRGLCEHLLKPDVDFVMSSYRDLSLQKLSALSVDELSRLKFCRQTNGEFIIKGEPFSNFWDFMKKKVFPNLTKRGKLPLQLLPQLLGLIERYYILKEARADYSVFKHEAKDFFALMSKNELHAINYFYGLKIPYQGSDYYLLDYLIAINRSRNYDLDDVLNTLIVWLYNLNPALKSSHQVLRPVYALLPEHYSKSLDVRSKSGSNTLNQCFKLILSLLTTTFEMWPFTGGSISLWDKSNYVFPKAIEIYQQFLPALINDREKELKEIYSSVIEVYFNAHSETIDFFSWAIQCHSTTLWYDYVGLGKLSDIDIEWYEPELLLHTLLHFKPSRDSLSSHINLFIDELIHTYAQNSSNLLKRFRVNILFKDLLNKLDLQDRNNLKILLKLYDLYDAKNHFLDNCAKYVRNRLVNISVNEPGKKLHFYVTVYKVDSSKVSIPSTEFNQVSDIVDAFKLALNSPKLNLNKKLLENMLNYLSELSRPILTVGEMEVARSSALYMDYLASPT